MATNNDAAMATYSDLDFSFTTNYDNPQTLVLNISIPRLLETFVVTDEGRSELINQTQDNTTATMSFPFYGVADPFFRFELEFSLATELPSMTTETRHYLLTRTLDYLAGFAFPAVVNFGVVIDVQLRVIMEQSLHHVTNEELLGFVRMIRGHAESSGLSSRGYSEGAGSSSWTLPRKVIKGGQKGKHEGEEVRCSVCLEDIIVGVEFSRFPCSHVFHQNCIDQWLETSMTCPNCRFVLEVEEEEDDEGIDLEVEEEENDDEGIDLGVEEGEEDDENGPSY